MERVVFDTNIYISALLFSDGIPRKIFRLAQKGEFSLLISKSIMAEIRGVLHTKFDYDFSMLEILETLLLELCSLIEPKARLFVVKEDPDDNKMLECALEGGANIIVSGDRHLLELGKYQEIVIMTARDFFEMKDWR